MWYKKHMGNSADQHVADLSMEIERALIISRLADELGIDIIGETKSAAELYDEEAV